MRMKNERWLLTPTRPQLFHLIVCIFIYEGGGAGERQN